MVAVVVLLRQGFVPAREQGRLRQLPRAGLRRRHIGLQFGPRTRQVQPAAVIAEFDALPGLAIERLVSGGPTL